MKMNIDQELRFIKHSRIDFRKYDKCIENAFNSPVYACSWFLDCIAGNWDLLVWGDYDYIMPVANKLKWGIRYVYQPVFAQQLGIYPTPPVEIQIAFFEILRKRFRYIHYHTGEDISDHALKNFTVRKLHTRILSLAGEYPKLEKQYDKYIIRNLKKASSYGIRVIRNNDPATFFRIQRISKIIPVPRKSWTNFGKLMEYSLQHDSGYLYTAVNKDNNILAVAFFLVYKKRIYYMMVVSDEEGHDKRAGFILLDQLFRDFAGQPFTFDFEGSSVEGVDNFFSCFGAVKAHYQMISCNRLPRLIRFFKR
jgi:hypothetical protein